MQDKTSKIILLASELVIFCTFFSIFMINFIQNEYLLDLITSFVMFCVLGFIVFEGLIEVYKFLRLVKILINRFKVNRRQKEDSNVNSAITL